jgi:hypothetical protein
MAALTAAGKDGLMRLSGGGHVLAEVVRELGGYIGVCVCAWRSQRLATPTGALQAHREHQLDQASRRPRR